MTSRFMKVSSFRRRRCSHVVTSLSVVTALLPVCSEAGEFCYNNYLGVNQQSAYCPSFCCGNDTYSYCCSNCTLRLTGYSYLYWCTNNGPTSSSTAIILGCILGLTVFVGLVLLVPSLRKYCHNHSVGFWCCPQLAIETVVVNHEARSAEVTECEIQVVPSTDRSMPPADILFVRSQLSLAFISSSNMPPPYKENDPESQPPSFEDALRPDSLSAFMSRRNSPCPSPMQHDGGLVLSNCTERDIQGVRESSQSTEGLAFEQVPEGSPPIATEEEQSDDPPPPYSEQPLSANTFVHTEESSS